MSPEPIGPGNLANPTMRAMALTPKEAATPGRLLRTRRSRFYETGYTHPISGSGVVNDIN